LVFLIAKKLEERGSMADSCSGGLDESGEAQNGVSPVFTESQILDSVFQHLREKELIKCRLVCVTWNVLTIPFIEKNPKGHYSWE